MADDAVVENGHRIYFVKGVFKHMPHIDNVLLPPKEWRRIKELLRPVEYEQFYGRKPLVNGIKVYMIKN